MSSISPAVRSHPAPPGDAGSLSRRARRLRPAHAPPRRFLNIDVNTGYPVRGASSYTMSHLVRRTDRVFSTLYDGTSPDGETPGRGLWVPSHSVRVSFDVDDESFERLVSLHAFLGALKRVQWALIVSPARACLRRPRLRQRRCRAARSPRAE